ncbi:hypothetical protein GO730_10485 [Spirosoma sp. HMF3257]|uniref:DUF3999 domain-containing protein n=1 Tax=Spirosoma telluris TaxID=2183553 RepID=A0A327NPH3_9BACT|nr:hypothetical protein [Spirosoma telluris]RAI74578.1 hypothetical protein HMF3257_10395 [Spirosoma telluris]
MKFSQLIPAYKLTRYTLLLCLLSNATATVRAQSFRLQTTVNGIPQSGFYRIQLPPDVVGRLNTSLTDIRLYDGQQQQVPYVLIRQQPAQTAPFVDYELVSKQSQPNVSTTLVIHNQTKRPINSLDLLIKNTNVSKKARLSGSSDAQNWYALDDAIWLGPTQHSATTTEVKQIDFPLSDYAYYRLVINDSLSTPLNILRVGYYSQRADAGAYSAIPNLTFSQRDSSDQHTYVHVVRADDARFDKITLSIKASGPFRRRAEIGQFHSQKRKRGYIDRWFEVIRSIELSSTDSNVVHLPGLKAKDLYVVIANDDNPPLKVQAVQAYQLTTYLLANLVAGQSYQLHFSADNGTAPIYDLTPFKTVVPGNQPIVGVGSLHPMGTPGEQTASFFTDSRVIWPALGLVLLVLGLLSYRMLRDIGHNQPN